MKRIVLKPFGNREDAENWVAHLLTLPRELVCQ